MTKLTIEVDTETHKAIKAMAALQGKTLREFVLAKILNEDESISGEPLTLEILRDLREGKGVIRYKSVKALMKDLRQDCK